MGYCVLHCKKGKQGESLGYHIDRTEGKEYSYRHSDETRRNLNENFASNKFQNLSLNDAINLRISEGYTGGTAIRKDAVRFVETIFSGSHDDMIKIQNDPNTFNHWKGKTIAFAKATFGEENIIRMSLHLDEETPHFHCVSVPIIDGRLSAKKILTRQNLSNFQTDYAAEMAEFGLMRGELGSEAVHDGQTEYNANLIRQAKMELETFNIQIEAQRALLSHLLVKTTELTVAAEKIDLKSVEALKKQQMELYGAINSEWVRENLISPKESLFPEAKKSQVTFFALHPNFKKMKDLGNKIKELESPQKKIQALKKTIKGRKMG